MPSEFKTNASYSETFEIIHSRGVIALLAIYKIPKLKHAFVRFAIRL